MADVWAKDAVRCIVCGTRSAEAEAPCGRCDGRTVDARIEAWREGGHARRVSGFARGFGLPLRGLRFLMANLGSLWLYVLLPVVINVILFVGAIVLLLWLLHGPINSIFVSTSWWAQAIEFLIEFILFVVALVASFFAFAAVGTIVAAPFSELLSEKVEDLVMGKPSDEPFSWKQFTRDVIIPIVEGLKLLAVQLAVLVPCVLFLWVPVVGQIPMLLVLVFFAGLDFIDPVLERKRYRMREKIAFLWRHKALCMGFGTACYVALLVPFVQLLVLPISVIGGTLMYLGAPDK